MSFRSRALSLALAGGILATTPSVFAQEDCSVLGQNTFVRDTLVEFYLWYQELPDLDPALFDSPEAYLDAVRFRPLDARFSSIRSQQETRSFFSNSQFVGWGFSSKQTGPAVLRISQVFPDSPAAEAGLTRGDTLVEVDGRPISELLETGQLGAAFGPSQVGFTAELTWRTLDGEERRAVLSKRLVTIPTVSQAKVFDIGGLPTGYLHFRNFVEPSVEALNQTFSEFRSRGVADLILDLRYNGGGLVAVAQHLASLIGGMRTSQRVFVELVYNDKNTFRNEAFRYEDPQATLDLPRVVVITTRSSASASEVLVNGLRPFIPVTTVGDRTVGKPVGQSGFDFCDKVLLPVTFRTVNANGEGDFFGGIPADCAASDDLARPLGNRSEASLAEAIHFLRNGRCGPASTRAAQNLRALRQVTTPYQRDGWGQTVNAW